MIPEAVFAMLASTHIGAIHVVVFGGFAPAECAKRIESAKPTVILTASCGVEGSKTIPYLPFVRQAIALSAHKPLHTIVFQRDELYAPLDRTLHELPWTSLVRSYKARNGHNGRPPYPSLARDPDGRTYEVGASLPATAPHYLLHTSGTTGTPKPITRALSHLVGLSYTRHLFNLSPGTTIFTASDIGWVVGHSYIIYAPLLAGATSILYEGKPTTTPDASSFFRIIAENRVNTLSCAPSAFRAILASDPELARGKSHNTESFTRLFLAGERSEPTLITSLRRLLPHTEVIDNWWSTESGSPISAAYPGSNAPAGSAGRLMPGFNLIANNGRLEFIPPLPPTGLVGVYESPKRFAAYFTPDGTIDTGDLGRIERGVVTIDGRSDDIINVASHRLSAGTIEEACRTVQGVAEAYVVPVADPLKGEVPVAFLVLGKDAGVEEEVKRGVQESVRAQVGPIAGLGDIWVVDAGVVPRTRSGKVLRRAFRGLCSGEEAVPEEVERREWRALGRRVRGTGAKL